MSISFSLIPALDLQAPKPGTRALPLGLKDDVRGKSGHRGFKVYKNGCKGFFRWIFGNAYRIKDAEGKIWYINKRSLKNWISANLGESYKKLNTQKIDALFKRIMVKSVGTPPNANPMTGGEPQEKENIPPQVVSVSPATPKKILHQEPSANKPPHSHRKTVTWKDEELAGHLESIRVPIEDDQGNVVLEKRSPDSQKKN